ncbi:mRNA turnover protein-like protein 4 [Cucurbitaria berberidis CBS 394.84]|uniref:Ribosome assembly factor mrt4 n=1 Tax=Cucurbitaria berberidis CBS 394.84 TaxID=1168544 RepID=A0A9P4GLE1_9PLEO|nr:mRNA turnover protein-like protein 4 [Cucurbitaria berberidis CBS 394.84]KAF1847226.1 mRNA turnover protein-like protein 4 [Cucurbitaria berberidis CBS 394.84]
MPKSKRAKVVHLTKTDKKGKELSQKLFANVQEAADNFEHIFVFSVENMRNSYLKAVRAEFSDSRFFFGKTKVMAKALGQTPAEEHLTNLSKLTEYLAGNVGLFFTNREPSEIIEYFAAYSQTDFARAGIVATQTFTIPAGTVHSRGGEVPEDQDVPLPHSVETTIRKWGMPTRLDKGKIILDTPYTVCEEGKVVNSHQTALLKMFGVAMADFKIDLKAYYSKASESVTEIGAMEE